jgi:hypothetical protein
MNDGLGPQPEPKVEEPEMFPGGTDAVQDEASPEDRREDPATRDLPPDLNPATEDTVPEKVAAEDDKTQEPDGSTDQEAGTKASAEDAKDEKDRPGDDDVEPTA